MDNISNNFPKIEELNAANCRGCALQNKWPKFYKYLCTTYPKGTLSENDDNYYLYIRIDKTETDDYKKVIKKEVKELLE